jgi:hypothetical protein
MLIKFKDDFTEFSDSGRVFLKADEPFEVETAAAAELLALEVTTFSGAGKDRVARQTTIFETAKADKKEVK